ncbi:aminopeptidase P family protein [Brucella cytisi]|uniref:aminopeptidase P family protein n=1 Tax=Brucella cytisi TaxID=407152 RepID=UPI0035DAA8C4
MTIHHDRLSDLRKELSQLGLDGFILATGDEHLTEFPASYSHRLAWLTGFVGSTGAVAVLADKAAIFVDVRYTETVQAQVDGNNWSYQQLPRQNVSTWLEEHAPGARIGYDPRLYTRTIMDGIERRLSGIVEFVALPTNPIDILWTDQPALPNSPVFVQPIALCGKSSSEKRIDVANWLRRNDIDACILVALDSQAWLFNIRASDVATVPLNYSYAICYKNGTADLFVDMQKINELVSKHLGEGVRLRPYSSFYDVLMTMSGMRVSLDPGLTPVAIYNALAVCGATIKEGRDPTVLSKAIKNEAEIEGMKRAHIRDGTALTRFLCWFSKEAPQGHLTELACSHKLSDYRHELELFHSVSFAPISAVDGNAAIPHYFPSQDSSAPIGPDSIYLIDSGGQYRDGTTDVTRTVAVGIARPEVRDRFTRVLKAYIALQTINFPQGTLGTRLDAIARTPLWEAGIDCIHGIGHGVGAFLNVHEGPVYLSPVSRADESAIEAGMILANEPGYYKAGDYGIRIENLMVVVERLIEGSDRKMLGFEPITLAPIDRTLIDVTLLTAFEIAWLDDYHTRVLHEIGPHLSPDERTWLQDQTAPLNERLILTQH